MLKIELMTQTTVEKWLDLCIVVPPGISFTRSQKHFRRVLGKVISSSSNKYM